MAIVAVKAFEEFTNVIVTRALGSITRIPGFDGLTRRPACLGAQCGVLTATVFLTSERGQAIERSFQAIQSHPPFPERRAYCGAGFIPGLSEDLMPASTAVAGAAWSKRRYRRVLLFFDPAILLDFIVWPPPRKGLNLTALLDRFKGRQPTMKTSRRPNSRHGSSGIFCQAFFIFPSLLGVPGGPSASSFVPDSAG